MFYSVQYKSGSLAASDLFSMFTQSIKFYTFCYTYRQYRCFKNVIYEIVKTTDCSFQQVFRQNLCWKTLENDFLEVRI